MQHHAYSNPSIPEGINATEEHPLKEVLWLIGGIVLVVVVIVTIFGWLGHWMGSLVAFETERNIAAAFEKSFDDGKQNAARAAYLQGIADRLTAADPLPSGMTVQVHFSDSKEVNAFATLGGHIIVTRGLIEAMPNENALAGVLGHEIAHVRERHVIRSLGRGVLTSIAMGIISGASSDDLSGSLVGHAGITTALSFSRGQELEADRLGQRMLQAAYGHAAGMTSVFETMRQRSGQAPPAWFSTHPDHDSRIAALNRQAREAGWRTTGTLTPVPDLAP